MQYLLLIYNQEKQVQAMPKDQLGAMMAEYTALTTDLAKTGQLVGGNRLYDVDRATTVRVRDGKQQITDGPFAETREQLGGYFLIEAPDMAAARAIAARLPGARNGTVEVRPIAAM